jgi:hypothetical protein
MIINDGAILSGNSKQNTPSIADLLHGNDADIQGA